MRNDRAKAFKATYKNLDPHFEIVIVGDNDYMIVYKEDYLKFQDAGVSGNAVNRPNTPFKYTNKQPPVSSIKSWLISSNIANSDEVDSMAFAIAKSIKKKGIAAKNYMPTSEIETKAQEFSEALAEVEMQALSKQLDKILK